MQTVTFLQIEQVIDGGLQIVLHLLTNVLVKVHNGARACQMMFEMGIIAGVMMIKGHLLHLRVQLVAVVPFVHIHGVSIVGRWLARGFARGDAFELERVLWAVHHPVASIVGIGVGEARTVGGQALAFVAGAIGASVVVDEALGCGESG